jgi:hypothetical protein
VQIKQLASRIGKGLLTSNLASVLRLALHGSESLDRRLSLAWHVIDPFDAGDPNYTPGMKYFDVLPEVHLTEIVREFVSINLGDSYRFIDGAMPWVDLVPLVTILHDRKPKCMLEIGTYFGYTTRVLAQNFPETTIHTVDLPQAFDESNDSGTIPKDDLHLIKRRRVGEAFVNDTSIRNVVQHFGDTATWDFSPAKDSTLFFIDGSHTYDYVRNDTENCLALCNKRRATLLWHDCDRGHPGVVRYLAELVQAGFPIKRVGWTHLAIMDV